MKNKIKWKPFLINTAIPLAVGGLAAILTRSQMNLFDSLMKPPLSPPAFLFPIVWTILYLLMGIAAYLISLSVVEQREKRAAYTVYGAQLLVNFFWSIIFFNLRRFYMAFFVLLLLWALILTNILLFRRINKTAGNLLIPYLLWVSFAGYLNLAIAILN